MFEFCFSSAGPPPPPPPPPLPPSSSSTFSLSSSSSFILCVYTYDVGCGGACQAHEWISENYSVVILMLFVAFYKTPKGARDSLVLAAVA
ncbi:hypothetical protein H671_1g1500 [Cricetulus griseus]|uniref:Uncharacterized protein n=1 Tax=Cricetulus griseus TaxID=10029 RepID=A0A061IMS5_CRIGR|nr:hypothetical protein H671_1g1500 [Cricetulus griseus]